MFITFTNGIRSTGDCCQFCLFRQLADKLFNESTKKPANWQTLILTYIISYQQYRYFIRVDYLYIIRASKIFPALKENRILVKYPMFLYFCPAVEIRTDYDYRGTVSTKKCYLERWVRGLNQQFAKLSYGLKPVPRVQIPLSPPFFSHIHDYSDFRLKMTLDKHSASRPIIKIWIQFYYFQFFCRSPHSLLKSPDSSLDRKRSQKSNWLIPASLWI